MAAEQVQQKFRHPAQTAFQDRAADAPQQLHIAQRRAAAPVIEVEIIETDGLLIDAVIGEPRIDGQHRRAVVVHEIAADLVGAVRQPARMSLIGAGQQQDRRIDRAGGQHDHAGAKPARLALAFIFHLGDPSAVRCRDQPADLGAGDEADIGVGERVGERPGLGIELARIDIGKGIPGRGGAGDPALDIDGQRQ